VIEVCHADRLPGFGTADISAPLENSWNYFS